jgi:hypothetical protein
MWIERARPDVELTSRCGRRVRVIDTGIHNRHDGPDFLGASVAIDGALRRGDIELHTHPEDWLRHGHGGDTRYARVILHVCLYDGAFPPHIPGIVLATQLGQPFRTAWSDARADHHALPCMRGAARTQAGAVGHEILGAERIEAMTALLAATRFARKRRRFELRLEILARALEAPAAFRQLVYEAVARAAGYGGNESQFEALARALPLSDLVALPVSQRLQRLAAAAVPEEWNRAGVMPHNRLARRLYWFAAWAPRLDDREWWRSMIATVRESGRSDPVFAALFRVEGARDNPGAGRIAEILINVLAPALHLHASRRGDGALARAASALYFSTTHAPGNRHTRLFTQAFDLTCETGGGQQGMIELATEFCQKDRCTQCLHAHGSYSR